KELIMNRLVAIASIGVFATLAVGVAHAGDEQMLNACIQQFIAANLSGYQGKISVHKDAPGLAPWSAIGGRTHVVVSATSVRGARLGSAVCDVDRDGNVVSLTPASGAVKLSQVAPVAPVVPAALADASSH